jgi:hypothetical protein
MNRKNFGIAAIALGLMLLIPASVDAQAPSSGPCTWYFPQGTWNITANGRQGTLFVTVDTSGNIGGTITLTGDGGVDTIRGFFNASACKLTFLRIDGPSATAANPTTIQAYTGYVYPALATNPYGQKRLAGSFETFSPAGGGTAARSVFGWDALRY